MKLILTMFVTAFLFSNVAQADQTIQVVSCQYFAKVAESAAVVRDQPTRKEEMKDLARESAPDPHSEAQALKAVDFVFMYPRLTPREEGNKAFEYCEANMKIR